MLQVSLSEADRQRFGCDEWLDADAYSLTIREHMAIQEKLGFTQESWIDAIDGEEVKQPDDTVKRVRGPQFLPALLGLVWVALRHAGVDVDLDRVDFTYDALRWRQKPEGDLGKDPSTPDTTSGGS